MNQRTIWGSQRGKWITLAAVVAILVALLAVGMVRAQDAAMMSERDYAENGTDPVVTLTAADPEERMVYWSLLPVEDVDTTAGVEEGDSDDASYFMITPSADGASASLSFKLPPDYEMPRGDAADTNNTYKVVVVAADDAPGAVVAEDLNETYHKLTVVVTDEDEDGSISLSALQPQVGVDLTATLMDDDAEAVEVDDVTAIVAEWKWEQASAMSGPWTLISGAANAPYMPAADVVGMYLRATATYDDSHGDDKTAMAVSANAVRAVPSGTNSDPTFPSGTDDNTREVDENSPPGSPVGDPVKASDAPGETLTYGLRGTEADNYTIDAATGQLRVGARGLVDADTVGGDEPTNTVTVWAMDALSVALEAAPPGDISDNGRASVEVNITIKNVNEAPTVSGGPTKVEQAEGDADAEEEGIQIPTVGTYTATDTESTTAEDLCTNQSVSSTCAWSLEGPDAADFTIDDGTGDTPFGEFAFKNAPDFENPADADMDNVYEVTVKVTDNGVANKNKMSATRDVMITVDNVNEDGEVTFSSVQPKVGRPFTATLTDPDGMTTGVTWQWWRTTSDNALDIAPPFLDADEQVDEGAWEKIADAKSDTYKPVSSDEIQWLIAMATYTDPVGSTMAMGTSANAVAANTDNVAPEFRVDGEPVMQATRNIAENSAVTDEDPGTVGEPVLAVDPNGDPEVAGDPEGILTYTLGGPDKDSFEIDASSGQITVGADTELDYESNKKTYMVTVTATDPSQAMATIDVTIMVDDVNEAPKFTAPSEGDVEKTVQENARSLNIYPFQATDPERRKVYWSLDDTSRDAGQFTISDRGVLSLNASPDYEAAVEVLNVDKQYTVVVVASDDAPGAGVDAEDPIESSTKTVTVTVTDMEEPGTITLDPKYPHLGSTVEATLTDGDGQPTDLRWRWTAGGTADADVVGTDSSSYDPVDEDVNKILRVKATYTDGGEGQAVSASAGRVREAPDPDNVAPEFDDNPENKARKVAENARNTRLGNPIKATDANDGTLTYTVGNANFSISSTGQLSTAAMLDHEEYADGEIKITITATDPWGDSDTIEVTVTVEDVNEAPMINTGLTRRDHAENTATEIDTPIDDYGATDAEDVDGAALTWSLEGDDAAMFNIAEAEGTLTFKESPNYEMPADRNKDNVYKVTVVVSDDGTPKLMDKRQVEVTVTDAEEDGTVTLSAVQPKTGIDLMASLTDPDNVTSTNADGSIDTGVTWQWWRTTSDIADTALPPFLDSDEQVRETDWDKIVDAKSDTYKPVSGDVNRWLNAMATYTDRPGSGKSANMSSANAVIVNNDNAAPVFEENNEEITETTRKVKEDAKPNEATGENDETTQGNVGDRVMATDPNPGDLLTYTLSGSDAALFEITNDIDTDESMRGGQISLNAGTKLDYEARTTYMVTVTAADPDGEIASVDVTIKVTDDNEAPIISTGPSIVGPAMSYYAENDMVAVASYEGAALNSPSWSLSGDDAEDFGISSDGMLTFNNTPDYEMPEDAGGNNVYDVTVKATDGTNPVMKNVKVMVTNVDEMGEVTLWAGMDALTMAPQVGDTITGAVMDPDGGVTGETWQWSRTMDTADMTSWMDIQDATDAAYMVTAGDAGYYLRVMATYTDAAGTGMAMEYSPATMMVGAEAGDTLLDRYDANDNNEIDLDEIFTAIDDYFDYDDRLTLEEVYELVDLYFES